MSRVLTLAGWFFILAIGAARPLCAADPASVPADGKLDVVMLNSHEPMSDNNADMGLLLRELGRQAVLIAARDGLGLPTRDQTLREPFPEAAGATVDVQTKADIVKGQYTLELVRDGKSFFKESMPIKLLPPEVNVEGEPAQTDYFGLAEALEPMTRGALVDALKAAGFHGNVKAPNPDAKAPADIERLLGQMSVISQFDALRAAHQAIASAGESPALLGILVRGYANLGELTADSWNTTPKAFHARSLLYAQRMMAVDKGSAQALWHRAYARAMVGFHAKALEDLTSAAKLAGGNAHPPAWAALLEPFCRFDTNALVDTAAADAARAPLAMYLCYLTVEDSSSDSLVMEMGKQAIKMNPLCLRVVDSMTNRSGVRYGHALTQIPPQMIVMALRTRLMKGQVVPAAVRQAEPAEANAWGNPATIAAVERGFVEAAATDTLEPSWGVLGRMLQESSFLGVKRRTHFLAHMLGVDATAELRQMMPLIASHPYRAYVESIPLNPRDQQPAIRRLTQGMKIVDLEARMFEMCGWLGIERQPSGVPDSAYGQLVLRHGDGVPRDVWLAYVGGGRGVGHARLLRQISPNSPIAAAALIEGDWQNVLPQADKWEKEFGYHPDVRAAFARKYIQLGDSKGAERNLLKYLEKAPDEWAYSALADVYLARGDEAKWLSTLNEFLTKEDYALSHTRVEVKIANHYMQAADYKSAQPYAEAAAQSWAQWGMQTAIDCYIGLGEWDKAELWVKREAQRYGSPLQWYYWCKQTGHGDLDAARKLIAASDRAGAFPASDSLGFFYLGEDQPKEALRVFREVFVRTGNPASGMHAALLLDADNDAAGRDQILRAVAQYVPRDPARVPPNAMATTALAKSMAELLNDHFGPDSDPQPIEGLFKLAGTEELNYFLGRFLALHGHPEDARRALLACTAGKNDAGHARYGGLLAPMELKKLGAPAETKDKIETNDDKK
ncbi:MAG: hypothetical protein JWL69_1238 [Phycisphaerales bacterium]|nr:hypothetical protein [Phycisphaerales bacterium]